MSSLASGRSFHRRRHVVGVSALAVGALLSTYSGALRTLSYARAASSAATCSVGATLVADDTQLQAAILSSQDDSVICITNDITVSATLAIDDTTLTLEGRLVGDHDPELSGDNARRIIDADFTDNSSDDTLTIRGLVLVTGRASGDGGALKLLGGNRSDALVLSGVEVDGNYSTRDGGGVSASNLASVLIDGSDFHDDTVGDAGAGDIAGGALKVANSALTTISNSRFVDNSSVEWGGAVFLNDSGVTRITGTLFEGNFSGTQQGGAIEVDIDDSTLPGALYIEDTVFRQNYSTSGQGGAVRVTDNDDTVTFDNVTFDGNSVRAANRSGGGLNISYQSGPVFLTDITATDNEAGSSGGFLRVSDMTSTLTIDGLDSQRNEALADGGSIKQTSGSLKLLDSTFADDSAGIDGGAVYVDGLDAVEVSDSQFSTNYAGEDGGAFWLDAQNNATFENVTATQNVADRDGGAVYAYQEDDTLSLTDVTLTGNVARRGGGGLYVEGEGDAYVTISRSTFERNSATTGPGGGVYVDDIDTVSIGDSSFIDDTAGGQGGAGFFVRIYSSVDIEGSTFSGNHASAGGAIVASNRWFNSSITPQGAPLSVINSTFTGNSSDDSSGALWLRGEQHTIDFTSISGNSSGSGAGVSMDDTASLMVMNSIISGNSATGSGADVDVSANSTFDDSYSLFSSPAAVSGAIIDGPGSIFGAPKLNELADNGGPTLTMLPQWDSPAVKTGDPNWTAPPANDQRGSGFARNAGGRVNMGAIQGRSAQPPTPTYPPSAPREVSAVAGDQQAVVSWQAPTSTGSFPITYYQIDDSTGTVSNLVKVSPGQPLVTTIDELVNGIEYSFRVRALNGAGWGPWSGYSNPVIPAPEVEILITGSRDGRYVRAVGTSTGIDGQNLIPRVRFPGPKGYQDGTSRPTVNTEGNFTWQRKTGKKTYVYFLTEDRANRSNRVVIQSKK
jgi:hypothetical protein